MREICCGACPLYWEQRGGFDELKPVAPRAPLGASAAWRLRKALWSGTWGVGLRDRASARATIARREIDGQNP